MQFIFLTAAVLSGIHAFTYALWLKRAGNKSGAVCVFFLTAAAIGFTVYKTFFTTH